METTIKRLRISDLDLENEEEIIKYANQQEYIQPIRRTLNRNLREEYELLPGSERIILNEFHRRCAEKERFCPSTSSDAFYFSLKLEMIENVMEMNKSKDIHRKLECSQLKTQQIIIRRVLKENLILIEKLLRWKYDYFQNTKIQDKEKAFQFETLFRFFIVRRKEIHATLTEMNNHIAQIIIRAEESKMYLMNSIRMLKGNDE